ncbi:MAG: SCO family protein [Spirochaetia bacterium]
MSQRRAGGAFRMTVTPLFFILLGAALFRPAAGFADNPAAPADVVGIYENLGGGVPLDAGFRDETGAPVSLRELIHTPTILALVYYTCPNVCDYLLLGVAGAVKSLQAAPGSDYNVITISIDETEGPKDARKARRIALESMEKPFPPAAWRFLTGDTTSISRVARAVGYNFVRRATGIDHPVGIIILSPQGKIIRYMNGDEFLPADLKLSLLEASQGRVGPTIARVLRFCFSTDPKSHQLVFNLLKIIGTITILGACLLVGFLILATVKRKRAGRRSA